MTEDLSAPSDRNFLFYDTEDGTTRVQLLVDGQTVWMPQIAIAELFETSKQNVGQQIKIVLEDSELSEDSVVKNYFTTAADGKKYRTKHYNLDMILAIGYRVRSARGTQFRRWATQTLREYLVKGFVLNDDRLKAAEITFGTDYFDELLKRIVDIRASERRFYQKITDIYATASDYNKDADVSRVFFATVHNKLEWAITGMTAAELIKDRADANQPNTGLKTWKNSPSGKIRKTDVTVAEDQAKCQQPMTMAQWAGKLDAFLTFNDRSVLSDAGKVEKKVADELAIEQYEQFKAEQRRIEATEPTSDFGKFVDDIGKPHPPDEPGDD